MSKEKRFKNKAQCAICEDIIYSHSRHDFNWCKCGSIFVDGGNDYWRAGGKPEAFIRLQDEELILNDAE